MAADAPSGAEAEREVESELPGVVRLLSLSDGVVAIALTLLVLQLHVPKDVGTSPSALATALSKGADQYTSYLVSFYVIAQFWLAHHRVFRHVSGHHEGLAWWNFAFLFTITVMPFTSSLLGDYPANPLAVDIFALNLMVATLSTQAVIVYGRRRNLLLPSATGATLQTSRARSLALVASLRLSMGLAWVNTSLAKYCWILIAVAPWVATRWQNRRLGARASPA
jgi:uncharacterized membrane protein